MRKIIAIMVFILAGFATTQAQNSAKFEFDAETIDYGTIQKGSDGVRVFRFKNVGDEPLVVEDVKSSCTCLVPKKPKAAIMPGEKGEIEIQYDTKKVGHIRKTITVYSNTSEPIKALKIKGQIIDDTKG